MRKSYHFQYVATCNMCGSETQSAKILGTRLNTRQGLAPRNKVGISVTVCECRECRLRFANPLPIPDSLSDHYGIPPEEYWGKAAADEDPNYFQRQIADAKRLLNFREGMKALDIGVGAGKAFKALSAAGFDTWGIEPSEPFQKFALQRNSVPGDRILLVGIEDAEFDPETFDFITFGAVLEHLQDPALALEKAMMWLRPGGVTQIEVPSSAYTMGNLINLYYRMIGTTYVTSLSPMHSPFHLYEFTPTCFEIHGKKVGYFVEEKYYEVASIYHFPKLMHPLFRAWMEWRQTGMQLTVWLRKLPA